MKLVKTEKEYVVCVGEKYKSTSWKIKFSNLDYVAIAVIVIWTLVKLF